MVSNDALLRVWGGSSKAFPKNISWSSWRPGKSQKEGQQDQGVQR